MKSRLLRLYDLSIDDWVVEPGGFELPVGASSRDSRSTAWIEVLEEE